MTLPEPKYETAREFLVNPVLESIRNVNDEFKGIAKVVYAATGAGKTYETFNTFLPELFKNGVKIALFTAPTSEVLDFDEFEIFAEEGGYVLKKNVAEALAYLKKCEKMMRVPKPVVVATTNAGAYNGDRSQVYIDFFSKFNPNEVALFVDEASYGSTSAKDNLKNNTGNRTTHFGGVLYKFLETVSSLTNHLYLITATPPPEMRGLLNPEGVLTYQILNELPPVHMTREKCAPVGSIESFDMFSDEVLKSVIRKVLTDQERYLTKKGMKKTALFWTQETRDDHNHPWERRTCEYIVSLIQEVMQEMNFGIEGEDMICSLGVNNNTVYTRAGAGRRISEKDALDKMNDRDDPMQVCVLVMKGRMGMNVATAKNLVVVRPRDAYDEDGNPVAETAVQQLGRGVRINTSDYHVEFSQQNGTSPHHLTQDFWNQASWMQRGEMTELNTLNVYTPKNNDMWNDALNTFMKEYTTDVETWYDSMMNASAVCTSCGAPCTVCNSEEESVQPALRVV